MDILTSTANPLIKQVRALRQKKSRAASGTFLVEGIHHVGEAIEAGWGADVILHAPELLTSGFAQDLLTRASRLGFKLQPVSPHVMESLADKENPQGILAVVRQKYWTFDDLKSVPCAAALVSPQDPGNVGTILRTMDAVNADALFLLDGGVELYHPNTVRASMGALFWKPVVQSSFDEFIQWARTKKMQLIATSAKAGTDYREFIPQTPWALVLGNEQKGLSAQHCAACDASISLPMRGRASSLNLSVAAGVLLYRLAG